MAQRMVNAPITWVRPSSGAQAVSFWGGMAERDAVIRARSYYLQQIALLQGAVQDLDSGTYKVEWTNNGEMITRPQLSRILGRQSIEAAQGELIRAASEAPGNRRKAPDDGGNEATAT